MDQLTSEQAQASLKPKTKDEAKNRKSVTTNGSGNRKLFVGTDKPREEDPDGPLTNFRWNKKNQEQDNHCKRGPL